MLMALTLIIMKKGPENNSRQPTSQAIYVPYLTILPV